MLFLSLEFLPTSKEFSGPFSSLTLFNLQGTSFSLPSTAFGRAFILPHSEQLVKNFFQTLFSLFLVLPFATAFLVYHNSVGLSSSFFSPLHCFRLTSLLTTALLVYHHNFRMSIDFRRFLCKFFKKYMWLFSPCRASFLSRSCALCRILNICGRVISRHLYIEHFPAT